MSRVKGKRSSVVGQEPRKGVCSALPLTLDPFTFSPSLRGAVDINNLALQVRFALIFGDFHDLAGQLPNAVDTALDVNENAILHCLPFSLATCHFALHSVANPVAAFGFRPIQSIIGFSQH